ncbi:MAG TPA: pyridoxamine 5'-phosphate oxidase family protein, partial [Microbacteriaceae bacterium]|nr:pyridoxamine 5'-phosphate oxidase family protein [Microbacteriaceae bacterium]
GGAKDALPAPGKAETGTELSAAQIETIRKANTFFIGTSHPDGPADASHRGGEPGFIEVDSPHLLRWPDYNGNAMFMTLGNISLNPSVGLLFPDWDTGGLLQVSGRAQIDWDPASAARLVGAERVVDFQVDAVQETRHALPTRWSPARLSRYNPKPAPVAA